MTCLQFIMLLRNIGIPPDTQIHFLPKYIKPQKFTYGDKSFNVNFQGQSFILSEFDRPCYVDCIEGYILDIITVFGSDLLIHYYLED